MAAPTKLSTKALTRYLNEMGALVHTVDDEGNPISREQALADLLWKKALGYTEMGRDDDGNRCEVVHKPEAWAMQYIFERREGKAPAAVQTEDADRIRAADKVRELARERLNKLAAAKAGPSGPPTYKPKGSA